MTDKRRRDTVDDFMPTRPSLLVTTFATLALLACDKGGGTDATASSGEVTSAGGSGGPVTGTEPDSVTAGSTGSTGGPGTDPDPDTTGGGTPIPLIECPGEPAPPAIGLEPIACTSMPGVWCDGCPPDQWTIQCDRTPFPRPGLTAAGEPRVLVDPATYGMAPILVALGPMPTSSPLPGVSAEALVVDGAGAAHVLFPHEIDIFRLIHREDGSDTQVACLDDGVWVNQGLVAREGSLIALLAWLQDGPGGLALARRDGGIWTIEDLGLPALGGTFAVADDGTPLIAYTTPSPEGATPRVRVGDSDEDPGFVGSNMIVIPDLIPGATTYQAAFLLGPEGIEVAVPGPTHALLPDTPPLADGGCDALSHPTCDGPCQISGHGVDAGPVGLRDGDDLLLAYLDETRDIDGHFEGTPCDGGGPACNCEYVVDADATVQELVLLRVALPALTAAEVLRAPVPLTVDRMYAAQQGDRAVLTLMTGDAVLVAALDLPALP